MQLVIGDVFFLDVIPYILFAPVNQRVYLEEMVHFVPLYESHVLSGDALLMSQSADPGIQSLKGTS